ncbi:MAG: DUF104 domain-containing protein [Acidobacteria bacterium]|nr:DUF104 domain-containing protein [Acidobacteriota bacterium]MBI3424047.1 DUF104 domain-containing protein [Acidobacteriota bacterium]
MNQVITATYSKGNLRPNAPVQLQEEEQVEIEIRKGSQSIPAAAAPAAADERSRVIQAMAEAGLLANQPTVYPPPENPISRQEQERLGRLFAAGKPLSEIILEEREGR